MKDILQLDGKELSQALGEVLQLKECYYCGYYMRIPKMCKRSQSYTKQDHGCKRIWVLPIPLDDWNVAMKHFRSAGYEYGEEALSNAMKDVFIAETGRHNSVPVHLDWFSFNAEEKHNLKASALCKLNAEGSKE